MSKMNFDQNILLIFLYCVQLTLLQQMQQATIQLMPFITKTTHHNDSNSNQVENSSESDFMISSKMNFRRNFHINLTTNRPDNFESYYKLRFRPVVPMPRIFWHKLSQQKFNQTEVSTTIIPIVEFETTTTRSMKTTPVRKITKKPRPTVPVVFTTTSSIMRPPNKFVPILPGNSLLHEKSVLFFGSPFHANLLEKRKHAPKSKGKGFLSLFEVIEFNNTKCAVDMDDIRTMDGVCYHEFECKNLGGVPTKPCAEGAGVCCIFVTSCGDSSGQPVIYFESPNYPSAVREMMICVLIVTLRPNVEQLRLDFLMFELNRPTSGDCIEDQFIVSGQNMNYAVPILCGINTGQHIYIHVGNSFENKIYISFFAKVPKGGRSFNIKISQLEDDLAPPNCLQYFTETEGVVKSFNYDIGGSVVDNTEATYLNNLNYAICLERAKETCSVVYVTGLDDTEVPDFQIINKDEDENNLVPDGQAGAGIFNCPDDFISINSVRLCGERFNDGTDNEDFTMHAHIRDIAAGPIILPVRTDSEFVGRGFRLLYKQELCV